MRFRTAMWGTIVGVCVLAAPDLGVVQSQDDVSVPVFRNGVTLVTVSTTVRGPDDRLLTTLTRDDFKVTRGGEPIAIDTFDRHRLPLQMVVMFSTVFSQMDRLREAGAALIDVMAPGDEASIGSYAAEVAISPWHTQDPDVLRRVVREELWHGPSSPIANAIDLALERLRGTTGRRVVLVVGPDLREHCVLDLLGSTCVGVGDVERSASAEDVVIYGVRISIPNTLNSNWPARRLARATGGGYVVVGESDDLTTLMRDVLEELRWEYTLGFTLDTDGAGLDRVEVTTAIDGAHVHARLALDEAAEP